MSSSLKRPLAVFTIVRDEPVFLPKWLGHYGRQAPVEDLYVLCHGGLSQYAGGPAGVNVVPVHRSHAFDHGWLRDTVQAFQRFLLQSYDWVLFAEVDELVQPTPAYYGMSGELDAGRPPTLTQFLASRGGLPLSAHSPPAFRCSGYEVVHDPSTEPALDPTHSAWLEHRKSWYPATLYSKTLLASSPLRWGLGFHRVEAPAGNCDLSPEPSLLLVHLHKVDFDIAMARSRASAASRWSPADVASGAGRQNRITGEAEMRKFFADSIDEPGTPAPLVPIPAWLRREI